MLNPERNSRRITGSVIIAVLLAGLATGFGPSVPPAAASVPACRGTIGMQPPTPAGAQLTGVAVHSAADVWAVGVSEAPSQAALIEHWNGSAWTVVPSPALGDRASLTAVRAISADNSWAVGSFTPSGSTAVRTLTEHWNGSSWTVVPSPNPGAVQVLASVRFASANDGWAVGSFTPTGGTNLQGMIMHWNGTRWALVRSPEPGRDVLLTGIAATARDNAWAVGKVSGGAGSSTLIEHWNGSGWKRIASPDPDFADELESVGASSATNAWAVGVGADGTAARTLILHWNGRSWTRVASPNPGAPAANVHILAGVAVTSATSAWAVGESSQVDVTAGLGPAAVSGLWRAGHPRPAAGTFGTRTLVLHWNGTKWAAVASPDLGSANDSFLASVAATPGTTWAVGRFTDQEADHALAVHCG